LGAKNNEIDLVRRRDSGFEKPFRRPDAEIERRFVFRRYRSRRDPELASNFLLRPKGENSRQLAIVQPTVGKARGDPSNLRNFHNNSQRENSLDAPANAVSSRRFLKNDAKRRSAKRENVNLSRSKTPTPLPTAPPTFSQPLKRDVRNHFSASASG